ncbi:MAG: hypothetical protein ABS46_20355 [Cytophagaceae bacterium SCN 52-12]|nr:MAG: hypothetical protein ABS46_20355 [Cytophagaceae bacterium SCN 52-12]
MAAAGARGQELTGDSLSLSDCIRLALKNSYIAQSANLGTRLARIDHQESRQSLIPGVSMGVGHNLSQGRSIDLVTNQYINQNFSSGNQYISGSVTLFRGLEALNRIRQQAAAGKAAAFEEQAVKDQLMLDVILAYMQVLTARDMWAQTEKRIELTKQQVKRATDLHSSGVIPPSDFYDLKGQLAGDLNALNEIRKAHMEARINLARLMNIPYEQAGPVASISLEVPRSAAAALAPSEVQENAALWLPSLKAAEWRIAQAQDGIRVARAGHSPRLTMGGGFQSTYSSNSSLGYFEQAKNNLGRYLSFGLTIPLTDHILIRNNVARARINLEDAGYRARNTELEWQSTITQTLFNLELAKENYHNLTEREENLQESFRIATARFQAGDINSVLFLTAKNNLEQAMADKIIGRYQWTLQQYFADYFNGKLSLQ